MANFFEQIRKIKEMRNSTKEVQRMLEGLTADYENAGVKVVVSGDFRLKSIEFTDPSIIDPAPPEKLVRTLTENINKAIKTVKSRADGMTQEAMKKMNLSELGEMLRGM